MGVSDLRSRYTELTPQERAELYFAKAVAQHDEPLADALDAPSLHESYLQHIAELRIIIFGSYWMSKLFLLAGFRFGQANANSFGDYTEAENEGSDEDALEERGAALAVALKEFNDANGGWLKGVAALYNGEELWKFFQRWGELLMKAEKPLPIIKHLAEYREELASMWADMTRQR